MLPEIHTIQVQNSTASDIWPLPKTLRLHLAGSLDMRPSQSMGTCTICQSLTHSAQQLMVLRKIHNMQKCSVIGSIEQVTIHVQHHCICCVKQLAGLQFFFILDISAIECKTMKRMDNLAYILDRLHIYVSDHYQGFINRYKSLPLLSDKMILHVKSLPENFWNKYKLPGLVLQPDLFVKPYCQEPHFCVHHRR